LTPAELDFFNTNGYLVKPGFLSYTECSGLGTEVLRLIDEELDLSTHPGTSFSTGQGQTSDAYFLGSGDKIAFFFEAGALDGNGKLLVSDPKSGINKVCHFDAFLGLSRVLMPLFVIMLDRTRLACAFSAF
jgi:hypothetical protein